MRHLHTGRKLGVSAPHRRALLRSLTLALIEQDAIKTMPSRAKELRWYADRVVTWAKRGDLASRRQIVKLLGSTETNHPGQNRVRMALERVYSDLVPRFKDRQGGYTQIMRLVPRRAGDNSEMCIMRYIPAPEEKKKKSEGKEAKGTKAKETSKKKVEAAAPAKEEKREAKKTDAEPQDKKTKAKKKDK